MKVAFLDRDGTLIFEPSNGHVRPEDVRVLPGVIDSLRALKDQGFAIVIVSNQAQGVPRDVRERDFAATQVMLLAELSKHGITIDHVFVCFHTDADNCACKKPKTGTVDAFLKEVAVDKSASFMVGDRETDGEFAKNIGVTFFRMKANGKFPMTFIASR